MRKVVNVFKALSNEKRLKILEVVERSKSLSVTDITHATRYPYKTVSNHLQKLALAGLIKLDRDKFWVRSDLKNGVKMIIKAVNIFERRKTKDH